jgi:hypothetical protein
MDAKVWLTTSLVLWIVLLLGMPFPCGQSGCESIFNSKTHLRRHQNSGFCAGLQSLSDLKDCTTQPTKRSRLEKQSLHIDIAADQNVSGVERCNRVQYLPQPTRLLTITNWLPNPLVTYVL